MNISVDSVSQKYGSHAVLKNISFEAKSGEVLALLGPNGSGKSTLIKTIADILTPAGGSITIDGADVQKIDRIDRAKMIGYVPQYFHYTPFTTVLDTVLIGRRPYMSWSVSDDDLAAVDQAMATMNITDLSDRFVNELSGGQRQRVFIARALAQDPNFFLFDEPTSSLDLRHQLETVSTMRDIVRKDNSGMIIALHDLNLALRYTDKVLLLKDGEMYDHGAPADVLTPKSLRDVYGVDAEFVENAQGRFILSYAPS
ncbi:MULTISPECIES: ABC transporter ATP-binding protein [Methanocorpusculum]|jgi:iron complex transport system ATP-binding protein|uniref:Cobalamin import ATP-binding protein BtuD n=1 Tax=Methanocorpusculum parvum TaxID=2193 RepID=A0AAX0Q617_9EURY|nr:MULTISPECIES: ABC transporter ATP-binding protein [Methanocorpusculum]MDD2249174.1 ABC transporter ATP-binding protein [Methanocorpusculum sp.]MDD2803435.1 ABC transporter ATP-binding protein [Methanocorpusculum sp.]MDD3047291.1 ABC transporter ATP-binding protein [Methanocorpusculum sp.]MDD3912847.1 ABC transporter ATP-binding protein [Methanocorpusculum sp.]MDD4423880.1 ABC transporter ATP-binding protein [Methanocorpusculum parvum]